MTWTKLTTSYDTLSKSLPVDDCLESVMAMKEYTDKISLTVFGTNIRSGMDMVRCYTYNALEWDGMEFLKDYLREGYEEYTGVKGNVLYAQCWANYLLEKEQISNHDHLNFEVPKEQFVSGHYHVKVNESSFNYYGEKKEPVVNKNGMITIFSPNLTHYTDVVVDDQRVSLGFDIINEDFYNQYENLENWIKI